MTYVDTSVLFSLYVPDANSAKADAWRQANPESIDFTGFHRIELRNALSLAVFQQRLTPTEAQAAWTQIQEDFKAGVLVAKPDLWAKLVPEAEALATHHMPTIGTRSLDVLHVSAALVIGTTEFCTFDARQGKLAHPGRHATSTLIAMQTDSTPLTAFHTAVRAILDGEDGETHTAYKVTEKIKTVVNLGSVPRYRISSDGGSIQPALTPESDRASYALLVYETVLAFPKIPKQLRDDLDQKVWDLKNGAGCG